MGFCSFTGQFVASLMLCVQWELHPEQQIYQQLGPYTQNYEIGRRTSTLFLCIPSVFLCKPNIFLRQPSVFLPPKADFSATQNGFLCQPKNKVCGFLSSPQTPPAEPKTLVKTNVKCRENVRGMCCKSELGTKDDPLSDSGILQLELEPALHSCTLHRPSYTKSIHPTSKMLCSSSSLIILVTEKSTV